MRRLGMSDLEVLEQLFDQLPESPFFVKDREHRYVAANAAMARLCGVRRAKDLYGRRAAAFFPEELAVRYEALDDQVMTSGCAVTDRLELSVGAGATPTWLLFSRIAVMGEDRTIVGVAATSRRLKQPEQGDLLYRRLALVADRLRNSADQSLRLGELAGMAGVSKSQLERDFLRLFGVTPRAFLQQARMERALRLLDTNMSVAAVAYECGYTDHSAFTRRFHSMTGMSPRTYRSNLCQSRR
jgi:AraC-like DNA-binding protein